MSISFLLAVAPCVVSAGFTEGLGRLFMTGQERAEIDRLRASAPRNDESRSASSSQASPSYSALRLDGVVRRSDGPDMLWVNGERMATDGGMDARDRVRVHAPGGGRPVWMKPGQVFDPFNGTVHESYQPGRPGP
ncbi:MAG: hypothetical protein IT488_01350 [Gammaproteobacteria bacterium]|nr:hypothetical protein [Gammaproteobacteria bacterium]